MRIALFAAVAALSSSAAVYAVEPFNPQPDPPGRHGQVLRETRKAGGQQAGERKAGGNDRKAGGNDRKAGGNDRKTGGDERKSGGQ
jgi:hypothetical protein